jgi:hypothetical protein
LNKFLEYFTPILLSFVFPYIFILEFYSNLTKNEPFELSLFLLILSLLFFIGVFYSIKNLNKKERIKGIHKNKNKILISEIIKKNNWNILEENKNMTSINFLWKDGITDWGKKLTIFYVGKDILINCISYGRYSKPSPFHWFANKRKVNKLKKEFEYAIEKQNMNKLIQPKFNLKIDGMKFLGRGSKASGKQMGWSSNENIIYKCVECGSEMLASHNDYWNCKCGAIHLDFEAGRFGSNYGDENILVYKKNKLSI